MTRPNRNPKVMAHMAAFILERRKELRLSLEEVAIRCKSSKTHIWELEKGRSKNPTLWMLLGLCEALQCSMNSLIGVDISQPMYTENEMALIDAHRQIFGAKP